MRSITPTRQRPRERPRQTKNKSRTRQRNTSRTQSNAATQQHKSNAATRGRVPAATMLQHRTIRIHLPTYMNGSVRDNGHARRWQGGTMYMTDQHHALTCAGSGNREHVRGGRSHEVAKCERCGRNAHACAFECMCVCKRGHACSCTCLCACACAMGCARVRSACVCVRACVRACATLDGGEGYLHPPCCNTKPIESTCQRAHAWVSR